VYEAKTKTHTNVGPLIYNLYIIFLKKV